VPLHWRSALKIRAYHHYAVVTAAGACTGVAGVEVAVVVNLQSSNVKGFTQLPLDHTDPLVGHGSTFLNGFTSTDS
jgi:hypothetical protein